MDCPDAEALAAFKHSVRDEWLARHLGQEKPKTMAALTALMPRLCAGEESWLARRSNSSGDPGTSEAWDGNGKPRRNKNKRRSKKDDADDTTVNAGFSGSKSGQQKKPFKGNRDGPSSLDKILERPRRFMAHPTSLLTTPTGTVGFSNRLVR